jgi:hypothetical protein
MQRKLPCDRQGIVQALMFVAIVFLCLKDYMGTSDLLLLGDQERIHSETQASTAVVLHGGPERTTKHITELDERLQRLENEVDILRKR